MTYLLPSFRDWACPNCGLTDRTPASTPNRYHQCAKLRGLTAPLLPAGVRAKVTAHEREDYVGADLPHRDAAGRPVYLVQTTRDDGTDALVFPPTARVGVRP